MGHAQGSGHDPGRAPPGEAGDTVDARCFKGVRQGHHQQRRGALASKWECALGDAITLCHQKSVDVGQKRLYGRLWRETKVPILVQGGDPSWAIWKIMI